jgi:hypothetical protein
LIQKLRPNTQKLRIVEPPSSIPRILDLDFRFHHLIWSFCFSFLFGDLAGFVPLLTDRRKEFQEKKKEEEEDEDGDMREEEDGFVPLLADRRRRTKEKKKRVSRKKKKN